MIAYNAQAHDRVSYPVRENMYLKDFLWDIFNLCWKVRLASAVLSIIGPVAVDAWSGLCVGMIIIESSGWIAIMLTPESSIIGILLNPFLYVVDFNW